MQHVKDQLDAEYKECTNASSRKTATINYAAGEVRGNVQRQPKTGKNNRNSPVASV